MADSRQEAGPPTSGRHGRAGGRGPRAEHRPRSLSSPGASSSGSSSRPPRADLHQPHPFAFVAMGLAVNHGPWPRPPQRPFLTIRSLAEITLALVLFTDASRVNLHELRRDLGPPVRLLAIGLPLTIGFGTAAAFGIIPGIGCGWPPPSRPSWPRPTPRWAPRSWSDDESPPGPAAPQRRERAQRRHRHAIRQPLPGRGGGHRGGPPDTVSGAARGSWSVPASGSGSGVVGGWLLRHDDERGWSGNGVPARWPPSPWRSFRYSAAIEASANGFVASFVAGMAFGSIVVGDPESTMAFTEEAGELLSLLVWLAFGAVMVVPGLPARHLAGLRLRRPGPDADSHASRGPGPFRSGLDRVTVLFVGWFGPRGWPRWCSG